LHHICSGAQNKPAKRQLYFCTNNSGRYTPNQSSRRAIAGASTSGGTETIDLTGSPRHLSLIDRAPPSDGNIVATGPRCNNLADGAVADVDTEGAAAAAAAVVAVGAPAPASLFKAARVEPRSPRSPTVPWLMSTPRVPPPPPSLLWARPRQHRSSRPREEGSGHFVGRPLAVCVAH
jgi:hypothetical protein